MIKKILVANRGEIADWVEEDEKDVTASVTE